MCGIVGTNFNTNQNFKDITKIMTNRGPDFCDIKQIDFNLFGHTRLSVVDLKDEANQPMVFDDILVVFNGEIYNFKSLKKKLGCGGSYKENFMEFQGELKEKIRPLLVDVGFKFKNKH